MARPQTKSPPIQFRIPLDLWPTLEAMAQAKGQPVNDFVAGYLTRAIEAKQGAK